MTQTDLIRPCALGDLLRSWRAARGVSQLDLAVGAEVSQRHLSFIESGRSVPSREKLMQLAEALEVPLRERNELLLAAGYAPIYAEMSWNAPTMGRITDAVQRMLRQQEPYPALLMDRWWNVLATNDAAPRFFARFIDLELQPKPRNLLRLMFDPAGMRPFITDWPQVSASLLERVRREATGRFIDKDTRNLLSELTAHVSTSPEDRRSASREALPMIPVSFAKDGWALQYFSLISTVGTPTTIPAEELRIECMFPADDDTERQHVAFLDAEQAFSVADHNHR